MSSQRSILVVVDREPQGDQAILSGLSELARNSACTMHVLHVVDPGSLVEDPERSVLEQEEEILAQGPDSLRRRVQYLALHAGFSEVMSGVRSHTRLGGVVATILQACVDYDADLLICGTHGRRGMDRLLEGSVAEELVRRARCPVLVARAKSYAGLTRTPRPDPAYVPGEEPARSQAVEVERVISTTLDSWEPSDSGPTGLRIL